MPWLVQRAMVPPAENSGSSGWAWMIRARSMGVGSVMRRSCVTIDDGEEVVEVKGFEQAVSNTLLEGCFGGAGVGGDGDGGDVDLALTQLAEQGCTGLAGLVGLAVGGSR